MVRRILTGLLVMAIVFSAGMVCSAEEMFFPSRQSKPMYVVADYAYEYNTWDEDESWYSTYSAYPKGAFLYNWFDSSDWPEVSSDYIGLDWGGDSGYIPREYLSETPPSVKAPVFVDYCEEWISLRKKPSASSSRIAKLDWGTRIDNWEIYNSDFLKVKVNGNTGYVSLNYIRQASFSGYGTVSVGNCEEWVSLRAEPRTNSTRLMKVPKGTLIEKWQSYGEFCLCEVDGVIGFIGYDYLIGK